VKIRSYKQDSDVIVYDADRVHQPNPELFDPGYWQGQGQVVGQAVGRGSALLLQTAFGPAVLRQYLRGGWPARFSRDRYLFTGFKRSRPLVEFDMLATLTDMGLPVPAPLAALCRRAGLFCSGWLLMERILDVQALADLLGDRSNAPELWRAVGSAIARFHRAGVVHADLNARNILVGQGNSVHLVDFDRARLAADSNMAFRANLGRLQRSLEKLWPTANRDRLGACWAELESGYYGGAGPA
jgi:3-deoxy-D-manno-octulosonic acid kinase